MSKLSDSDRAEYLDRAGCTTKAAEKDYAYAKQGSDYGSATLRAAENPHDAPRELLLQAANAAESEAKRHLSLAENYSSRASEQLRRASAYRYAADRLNG